MKWKLIHLPENKRPRSVFRGRDCKIYVSGYELFGIIEDDYISIADDKIANSDQEFWNIFGDSTCIIFQSFSDVYRYDYKNITKLNPPGNVMFGREMNDELLIPKIESGVYQIDQLEIEEIKAKRNLPLGSKVVGMAEPDIFATQNLGLFKRNVDGFYPVQNAFNEQLKLDQINSLIKTKSGLYVIGTILNGLYITEDLKTVKYHINKTNGLSNNTVLSLFEDSYGNLWCGLDKGVDLIKLNADLTYFYDKQGQLGSIFTSAIYKDALYLGTNQGVFKQDELHQFQLIEGSQGQVWSFLVQDGDLLCGHNKGTYMISDDRFEKISDITGGWCFKQIDQNRFLQSSYTGLVLFEKKNERWNSGTRLEHGELLIENFELVDHMIVGFHPHYGIVKVTLSPDYSSVISREVLSEFNVNNPTLIRCETGVIVRNKQQVHLISKNGALTNETCILDEDDRYVQKYTLASEKLSNTEQIANVRFNKPQNLRPYNIIGFNEGYIKIPNDADLSKNEEISIEFIMVNDVKKSIEIGKILLLQPHENDISFQFQSPFIDPKSIDLQYKLEGWDDAWYEIPVDGFVRFNNLQDGKYALYLSGSGKVFSFEIQPKWYESWLGYLLYLILGIIVVYYFNQRQQRHLRKQREKLEKEKEKELESERIRAKNAELENDVIYKNKMLANSTMTLVQKNKMLIDLKATLSKEMRNAEPDRRRQILHLIEKSINSDDDWKLFETTFAEVHDDFLEKLRHTHPKITNSELRLAAYIKMDLSSKEIAPLMNISVRSIENKRYRLRKKLEIENGSLKLYLQDI